MLYIALVLGVTYLLFLLFMPKASKKSQSRYKTEMDLSEREAFNVYENMAPELKAMSTLISHIIRADGMVYCGELSVVRNFAYEMYEDKDAEALVFASGLDCAYTAMNIQKACSQVNSFFPEYYDRYAICELLFSIVAYDKMISGNEWAVLLGILPHLNIKKHDISYFKYRYANLVNGGKHFNYRQEYSQSSGSKRTAVAKDMSQFYAVLGLEDGATQEEVQNAYRQLAKTYHPDTCQSPALQKILTEKFKEISNAYSQLKAIG